MSDRYGSVEDALEGHYDFSISEVIKESFARSDGAKLTFVGAFVVYFVLAALMTAIVGLFFTPSVVYYDAGMFFKGFASDQAQSLLASPVVVPLTAGLLILGIRRACDQEVSIPMLFDHYVLVWPLVFAAFFINLAVIFGFFLFILPGIYLMIAYMFTLPLMIERGMGIWEAMETSRRSVTKRWFSFFFYNLAITLIIALSAIPLGIGLIWTLPMAMVGYGILYRTLFGYTQPVSGIGSDEEEHETV